jgi:uncharacterized membrane protein YtjA (UPF0391 family)
MLKWSIVFFVLSLLAAFFGFGEASHAFSTAAQVLFYAFVILFSLFLVGGVLMMGILKKGGPRGLP